MSRDFLWIKIYESVKQGIQTDLYKVGEYLPPENNLTKKYAVSRHTVREALRKLKFEGYLESQQGGGNLVLRNKADSVLNVHKISSLEQLIDYAARGTYQIQSCQWVEAAPYVDSGSGSQKIPRWMQFDGIRKSVCTDSAMPICWTSVYVPEQFESIKDQLMAGAKMPVWQIIEITYQQKIKNIDQVVSLCTAPPEMVKRFQLKNNEKVVSVARIYQNNLGIVMEVSVNLYPAENFEFRTQFHVTP